MRRIAALFNKMSTTTQAPSDPPSSCPLLALFSLLISHLQTHSPHNTCNDRIRLLALCDFINSFNAVVNLTLHAGVREHGTNEGGVLGGLGGGADGAEFFDLLHEEVYISSCAQRYSGEVLRLGPNNIQSLSPYRASGAEDGEILLEGGAL